ncbi:hypothetical protein WK52_27715 [Burkholderia multivorans]|nr:hypothetical protein WK52_27715 [Burkholderia multivorans]
MRACAGIDRGQRVVATAQRCEHREAVAVRQPEVEQQQPVGGRAQRERSGVAVHSAVDCEAFLFRTLFEPAADRRIVLDEQYARVRCRS